MRRAYEHESDVFMNTDRGGRGEGAFRGSVPDCSGRQTRRPRLLGENGGGEERGGGHVKEKTRSLWTAH